MSNVQEADQAMQPSDNTEVMRWVSLQVIEAYHKAALQLETPLLNDTIIQEICSQLHEANGALALASANDVLTLSMRMETLAQRLTTLSDAPRAIAIGALQTALYGAQRFLREKVLDPRLSGLHLFAYCRPLLECLGIERLHPADFYFPTLDFGRVTAAIAHQTQASPLSSTLFDAQRERKRFEHGLLLFLRDATAHAGLKEMQRAVQAIQIQSPPGNVQIFWFSVGTLLYAIEIGAVAVDVLTKRLFTRLNQQIRRVAEGSVAIAERLLNDVLFFIAQANSPDGRLNQARALFGISSGDCDEPHLLRYRQLDAAWLAEAGLALNNYQNYAEQVLADGSAVAGAAPVEALNKQLQRLALDAVMPVVLALQRLLTAPDTSKHLSDALSAECVQALKWLEKIIQHADVHQTQLAVQAAVVAQRLDAVLHNTALPAAPHWLQKIAQDEIGGQAYSALQLELKNHLATVESTLDQYFREIENGSVITAPLNALEKIFTQLSGALSLLGQDEAVHALQASKDIIKEFLQPGATIERHHFAVLAQTVSALGKLVDRLSDPAALTPQRFKFDAKAGLLREIDVSTLALPEAVQTVEAENAERLLRIETEMKPLPQQAISLHHRAVLERLLAQLRQDADLLDDQHLRERVAAWLNILQHTATLGDAPSAVEVLSAANAAEVIGLEPYSASALAVELAGLEPVPISNSASDGDAPTATTTAVAASEAVPQSPLGDGVDRELLDIFLDEAQDLLQTVADMLEAPTLAIRDLRRIFHTLKGSSRMVGLSTFGECAWQIEQVLIIWLTENRPVNLSLKTLIGAAKSQLLMRLEKLRSCQQEDELLIWSARCFGPELDALAQALRNQSTCDEALLQQVTQTNESPGVIETNLTETSFTEAAFAKTSVLIEDELPIEVLLETEHSRFDEPVVAVEPLVTAHDLTPMSVFHQVGNLRLAPQLFDIYVQEATELIHLLEQDFQAWAQTPQRSASEPASRSVHSLAGSSATIGVTPIRTVAQGIEQVLLQAHADAALGVDDIAVLQNAVTILRTQLDGFVQQQWPAEQPTLLTQLIALADRLERGAVAAVSSSKNTTSAALPDIATVTDEIIDDLDPELLSIFQEEAVDGFKALEEAMRRWRDAPAQIEPRQHMLRGLHTLKGSARMAGAMRLGQLLHALESHVEVARVHPVPPRPLLEVIASGLDLALQHFDALSTVLPTGVPVQAMASADDNALSGATISGGALRVRSELIDRLVSDAGEVSVSRSRMEVEVGTLRQSMTELTENLNRLRGQLREVEIQAESQLASRREQLDREASEFDPLEFDRYTRMQELTRIMAESVGDLETVQQSLSRALERMTRDLATQSRLTRELQHDLMRVRMVPFGSVADRLFRITRQVAKETDRRVSLDIQGIAVEIDRAVLEHLVGPLEHLLRNAVVHGIEARADRISAGKPEQGDITLSVSHEGNEIIIVLADDGLGLREECIRAKAITQGLIGEDDVLAPESLAELIFQPGFSTAAQLTELAGRGIGMDAVRAEIATLGGRVAVHSKPGLGCRFTLTLPLTLATAHVVLVRAGGQLHAVQASLVERIVQLKPAQLAESYHAEGLKLDEDTLPLHYLSYLLCNTQEMPEVQRHTPVLIVRSMGERVAVHVDAIAGNHEVVVKHTGPLVSRISGISGACVMGSGDVVLILNPVLWRRQAQKRGLTIPSPALVASAVTLTLQSGQAARLATTPSIMVVDDSLTVRRVTQRLLEREGYRVLLAKDGLDALEQMQEQTPQVLLVDIEMPRMDGFDLTRHIRSDARMQATPIIMITSRIADKHRRYAESIGVNLYLGKPYQENELLEAVKRFIAQQQTAEA